MKIYLIGALLASAAFSASAFAADTKVISVDKFCADQRLSAADQAQCRSDLSAAGNDGQRAAVMESYQGRLAASPPLRNDLSSNEAGVKTADQPTQRAVSGTVITSPTPRPSASVTVTRPSGTSVTTGSSTTVSTSALICADTRLSAKDQDECSKSFSAAATDSERLNVMKHYEARVTGTPLRNDLSSNEAGVKNADQPTPK